MFDLSRDEERLMPHLHLSLQAGRRHDPEAHEAPAHDARRAVAFCDACARARPDMVFGADLIAGFPTETDEMFENTLNHVRRLRPRLICTCFRFRRASGTPAARMPQVKGDVIKARAARLRDAGA